MNRRVISWLITGGILLLIGSSFLVYNYIATVSATHNINNASAASASKQAADYQHALQQGVNLGGTPAPNFTLQDQNGATVSLDQLHGHPIVLTFFDSLCPHADCSLIAQYINWTARDLGAKSTDVNWVALTVNPWHDTTISVKDFLKAHQVTIPMHYLLGTPTQMQPLWNDYHMQAILQSNGVVIHTTGVYVLDAQGHELMFFDEGFDPAAMSAYLQHVLSQSAQAPTTNTPSAAGQPTGTVVQRQTVQGNTIELTATPAKFGTYTFTVAVQNAQGVPVQGEKVTATLTMSDMVMAPLQVALPPINPPVPGVYQATGVLSMSGQWHAVVQVAAADGSHPLQATFDLSTTY